MNVIKIQKQTFWWNEIAEIEFHFVFWIFYVYNFLSLHISTIKRTTWLKRIRIICSIQSCCANEDQWLSHGSHFSVFIRYFSFNSIIISNVCYLPTERKSSDSTILKIWVKNLSSEISQNTISWKYSVFNFHRNSCNRKYGDRYLSLSSEYFIFPFNLLWTMLFFNSFIFSNCLADGWWLIYETKSRKTLRKIKKWIIIIMNRILSPKVHILKTIIMKWNEAMQISILHVNTHGQ